VFWFWGPGWIFGLVFGMFWIVLIVGAIILLRRELPHLQFGPRASPALRLLEERYARGEISRQEFLERRAVLLQSATVSTTPSAASPTPPPATGTPEDADPRPSPETGPSGPTAPLPPVPPQE
jgi:putative membrane protein